MAIRRIVLLCALSLLATASFAKDSYLAIAGSAGIFRTDMRIFNPSQTKDIQVQAWFLPARALGDGTSNASVQPVTFTVAKRQMAIYNDVVASLFQKTGLGGIRLSSADDFSVSERVYATTTACSGPITPCTTGQGIIGIDSTAAKKNGVLIQLSTTSAFRTNIVVLSPNSVAANVTWRVYDKNNALVGQPKVVQMPPYGVVTPTAMASFGDSVPGTADLSDAWISYTSDQPLIAWSAVNDSGSTDSTSTLAFEDPNPPVTPAPSAHSYAITARSFQFDASPPITDLKLGDQVTLTVTAADPKHGFKLVAPTGTTIVPDTGVLTVGITKTFTFTVSEQGTYAYICTQSTCGDGHSLMVGSFVVGTPTEPTEGGIY